MLVAGCIVVSTGGNEDVDHQNKGIQIESKGILNLNISEPIKHFLMDSYYMLLLYMLHHVTTIIYL